MITRNMKTKTIRGIALAATLAIGLVPVTRADVIAQYDFFDNAGEGVLTDISGSVNTTATDYTLTKGTITANRLHQVFYNDATLGATADVWVEVSNFTVTPDVGQTINLTSLDAHIFFGSLDFPPAQTYSLGVFVNATLGDSFSVTSTIAEDSFSGSVSFDLSAFTGLSSATVSIRAMRDFTGNNNDFMRIASTQTTPASIVGDHDLRLNGVVIPEPSTMVLFGLGGIAAVLGLRRRR